MFNPDSQEIFEDERKAILNEYSTLEMLDMAYGINKAIEWLIAQLADLNSFCGIINMRDDQALRLAKIIYSEHKKTKFSEIMAFFLRFKGGEFGHFYGNVEPMVIASHLHDYLIENERKRRKWQNEHYEEMKARHAEQWEAFKNDVYREISEQESRHLLCEVLFRGYDEEHNVLKLLVPNKEVYELFDNMLSTRLHAVLTKHYNSNVQVYYILESSKYRRSSLVADNRNGHGVEPIRNILGRRPLLARPRAFKESKTEEVERAKSIINNSYALSDESLTMMRNMFIEKYHCTPKQYVSKHNNDSKKSGI